jgi:S-adenosylmethionine:tRNA ribosyltransferase-isomerase
MISPRTAEKRGLQTRLLGLGRNEARHLRVADLPTCLESGDVLVVNRSATLPASFRGRIQRSGAQVEIRLAAFQGPGARDFENWLAISFGSGNWRMPTESRGTPPELTPGDRLVFGVDLSADIAEVQAGRLLRIRFVSSNLLAELYRRGHPIQYSYLSDELQIWDQQTIFAGAPISVEPPSASFPLTWDLVLQLRDRGIQIASLLHGAGISSTGSAELDQRLPLAEWYEIPERTLERTARAKSRGHRVVAVGTTVVRALESAAHSGRLSGLTSLRIQSDEPIRSVTSLITGLHELQTSHMGIVDAFCDPALVRRGYAEADQKGYRSHEFGDVSLLDCELTTRQ